LQALEKYVPAMVGLYLTPRLTESLRVQVATIMDGIRAGPPMVEVEGVRRWEILPTTPPVFVFQKRTDVFRDTLELKCGALSAAGEACKGVVAKFKVGFERLLPTSSVVRCGKCKLYVCLHELMAPGCISPTRMGERDKMRKHVSAAVGGCGAEVAEGTSPRARLCSTVTGYLYWRAEQWGQAGHAAIHPLDLHRLGELLRWHIDRANVEPTGGEVELEGDSSSEEVSEAGQNQEEGGVDQKELHDSVMALMVTSCPGCKQAAELGEGCDLSVVACSKQSCGVSNWCVRCGKQKKLRVVYRGENLSGVRCQCAGALEGMECFSALWDTKWSVGLVKMAGDVIGATR
jgi:hypothetical protein